MQEFDLTKHDGRGLEEYKQSAIVTNINNTPCIFINDNDGWDFHENCMDAIKEQNKPHLEVVK